MGVSRKGKTRVEHPGGEDESESRGKDATPSKRRERTKPQNGGERFLPRIASGTSPDPVPQNPIWDSATGPTIEIMVAAGDDGPTAASSLRVPGDTRTSVQCSELHSRPSSRSCGTPGNAEQHGAVVLSSQTCSSQRAPEPDRSPPVQSQLVPRSTRSNTLGSSASRKSAQASRSP